MDHLPGGSEDVALLLAGEGRRLGVAEPGRGVVLVAVEDAHVGVGAVRVAARVGTPRPRRVARGRVGAEHLPVADPVLDPRVTTLADVVPQGPRIDTVGRVVGQVEGHRLAELVRLMVRGRVLLGVGLAGARPIAGRVAVRPEGGCLGEAGGCGLGGSTGHQPSKPVGRPGSPPPGFGSESVR